MPPMAVLLGAIVGVALLFWAWRDFNRGLRALGENDRELANLFESLGLGNGEVQDARSRVR